MISPPLNLVSAHSLCFTAVRCLICIYLHITHNWFNFNHSTYSNSDDGLKVITAIAFFMTQHTEREREKENDTHPTKIAFCHTHTRTQTHARTLCGLGNLFKIGCNFGSIVRGYGYVWTRLPATNDAQKSYAVTSMGILAVPHHLHSRRTSSMLTQAHKHPYERASEQERARERGIALILHAFDLNRQSNIKSCLIFNTKSVQTFCFDKNMLMNN